MLRSWSTRSLSGSWRIQARAGLVSHAAETAPIASSSYHTGVDDNGRGRNGNGGNDRHSGNAQGQRNEGYYNQRNNRGPPKGNSFEGQRFRGQGTQGQDRPARWQQGREPNATGGQYRQGDRSQPRRQGAYGEGDNRPRTQGGDSYQRFGGADNRGQQRTPTFRSNAAPPFRTQQQRSDRPQKNRDGEPLDRSAQNGTVRAGEEPAEASRSAGGESDIGGDTFEERAKRRGKPKPKGKDWSSAERGPERIDRKREERERFAASKMKSSVKRLQSGGGQQSQPQKAREVFLPQVITVSNLARLLGVKMRSLQRDMQNLAMEDVRPDALLQFDNASLLCAEYNLNAVSNDEAAFDIYPSPAPSVEERATMPFRPPIVTIMGHVDHGKTSLLDRLRSASVAAGEAGGITQHIGAFSVPVKTAGENGVDKVTFLDTPGHAAFSNMRSRGAKATDIVVLVVAADDGVMTQTKEVISLYQTLEADAQAYAAELEAEAAAGDSEADSSLPKKKKQANIQLVVAISKCDRDDANPQRVREQLGAEGIYTEDLGGEVPCIEISSKTGSGFDEFSETLAAIAELGDLRAPASGLPEGLVLESRTEKGRGNTATVLVTRGSLSTGDHIICGQTWAKVRQMVDSNGVNVQKASPGEAVVVSGWKELPTAGDEVLSTLKEEDIKKAVANRIENAERIEMIKEAEAVNEVRRLKSESDARIALAEYQQKDNERQRRLAAAEGRPLPEMPDFPTPGEGEEEEESSGKSQDKELRLILKADFSGTGEALEGALAGITTKGAHIKVLNVAVGAIADSDLALARTSGAHIIGFNVSAPRSIQQAATTAGPGGSPITIFTSPIIYEIIDHVSKSLAALLPPIIESRVIGEATVAQVFQISLKGKQVQNVAGCRVTNGTVERRRQVRILRNKTQREMEEEEDSDGDNSNGDSTRRVVWQGQMESLKHVKKEVSEMRKGTECGISFEGFAEVKEGDVVQSIEVTEKLRSL